MITNKNSYIEHIKDNEQVIVMRKILDKLEKVIEYHIVECTDFLDPYQQQLCQSFLNRFQEINYHEDGGYEEAERKSIIIYPFYKEKTTLESKIVAIQIKGTSKFNEMTHRDVLGAILGLGIKREKIGDITISENSSQVLIHKEMLDFLVLNFKNVNQQSIKITEIEPNKIDKGIEEFEDVAVTISSCRLDVFISTSTNMSRKNSLKYVEGGKVKVNWKPIFRSSYEIKEGDLISIRGFGRFKFLKDLGVTKKERRRIIIRKYI